MGSFGRTSSMIRERPTTNKLDNYIKNHSKYVDLIGLCMEISKYQEESGFALAYIIAKDLMKELSQILDGIKKECVRDYQDNNAQETYAIVLEELEHLRTIMEMY